jgi:8-oxo-dGTP pyrophosphatase MutT (NUDIX family)/preprotein translocase subunit Sec61beta
MPVVSEAQRRAMFAAAAGHGHLGISEHVGREFANADPGGHLPARTAKDMSRGAFARLRGLLDRFFEEEADEPEHREAGDGKPPAGRAASVAFTTADGRVLFVRRSKDEANWPDTWSLPGGRLEDDEEAEDAARRECGEELGDCGSFDGMAPLHTTRTPGNWEHTTFVVPVKDTFAPRLNEEHSDYRWAPVTELPDPIHPGVRATIEKVMEEGARDVHDPSGRLSETTRRDIGREGSEHREEMPAGAFLEPGERKYPVKEQRDGEWKYTRNLLLAAAREARMHGHEDIAHRADEIRAREFGEAEDFTWDEWSPEARAAAAEARKKNTHIRATATHERGQAHGHFQVHAGSHGDLEKHLTALHEHSKKSGGRYNVAVQNTRSGTAHSARVTPEKGVHERTYAESDLASDENAGAYDWAIAEFAYDWASIAMLDQPAAGVVTLAFDRESVREKDADGRLRVSEANISKANVCPYYGSEIPDAEQLGLDPKKRYMLLRDPDELRKAAPTFEGIPILDTHVPVTSDSFPVEHVIGSTGSEAEFAEPYLRNSLSFWPQTAIDDIESNARKQLSAGYRYRADMTPGVFKGVPYDGVMRDIRGNHLALVKEGRAGSDVVVGDSAAGLRRGYSEEGSMTAVRLTPQAALVKGALVAHFMPKMAFDVRVDLDPILAGVTRQNYRTQRPVLTAALREVYRGKLANDADIEDVTRLLEQIEGVEAGEDNAAAATEANAGLPSYMREEENELDGEDLADEEESDREMGALYDRRADDARRKLGRDERPEEEERRMEEESAADARLKLGRDENEQEMMDRRARDKRARDWKHARDAYRMSRDKFRSLGKDLRRAKDEMERCEGDRRRADDERRADDARKHADDARRHAGDMKRADDACREAMDKMRHARDAYRKARDARRAAHDEPPAFPGRPNTGGTMEPMDRRAMDAAIADAETRAERRVREAIAKERDRSRAVNEAIRFAQPWVGQFAMDSVEAFENETDVYRAALKMRGVSVEGKHPAAFKDILEAQPKPGSRPARLAADSSPATGGGEGFAKRYPTAGRIGYA